MTLNASYSGPRSASRSSIPVGWNPARSDAFDRVAGRVGSLQRILVSEVGDGHAVRGVRRHVGPDQHPGEDRVRGGDRDDGPDDGDGDRSQFVHTTDTFREEIAVPSFPVNRYRRLQRSAAAHSGPSSTNRAGTS
ncbi:hypothetical protein PM031_08495 [Halorubrum ezzemoulense]|uniref:hypothetical protein n=1 Tax=Halorubrum ezzemoulense TaxID=337243 RepID=UPI00232B8BAB|nr:hypothetical protein [Halorubrum ezzemoulense]MDB2260921.1 hypothetical protein [Halorubrum ezzemoulense]